MSSSTPHSEYKEVVNFKHSSWYNNNFEHIRCLGSGGFGHVFEAKHNLDGNLYAVKRVTLPEQAEERRCVLREVAALSLLDHKNIVRYFNSWSEESQPKSLNCIGNCGLSSGTSAGHMTTDGSTDHPTNCNDTRCKNLQEPSNKKLDKDLNCTKIKMGTKKKKKSVPENLVTFLYIQMELCKPESLFDWLQKNDKWETRDIKVVRNLFSQIVSAVVYIHNNELIHRDLKPQNILFSVFDGRVKVGDFGLATTMGDSGSDGPETSKHRRHTKGVGTTLYSSPEQRRGGHCDYDYKVDIYAMGLILFELFYPIGSNHERVKTFDEVRKGIYPKKFQETHPNEMDVVKRMLFKNPLLRPTAAELRALSPLYEHLNEREQRDSHRQIPSINKKSSHNTGLAYKVTEIFQMLRNHKDICDNMCTVMATCPEKLVQHLINKKSVDCVDKSYLLDLKTFAITLHFYSPETYESIRRNFFLCLPHPSVISMWYQQPRGWPGITLSSIEIMTLTNHTAADLLGILHVYEVKIREDVECRIPMGQTATAYYGYADVGNHLHGDQIDLANEALIIIAVTMRSDRKFPIGQFFGRNFTPSQKASLIKLCIDSLSASKFRVITVTLNGNMSSLNLASALGANFDAAPFKPYFMHNDTKYYLMIDPKRLWKLMKELFVQKRRLYHNEELIEYSFVEELHNNRNELQITDRIVSSLWNQSVAQGIERMQREVMFPSLGDSTATVTFIKNINKVVGIYGFRSSISRKNHKYVQNQIKEVYEYIQGLKNCNDDLVINFSNKFVFNTMLCNLLVLLCLCTDYIKSGTLKCLPMRKLVLQNFSLFFNNANFTAKGLSTIYDHLVEQALHGLPK